MAEYSFNYYGSKIIFPLFVKGESPEKRRMYNEKKSGTNGKSCGIDY